VNTFAPGAMFTSLVTDPREVIHDSDFVGQVFGSSNRYVRRDHAILQWNFLAGSPMFPMSMYVDNLVVTLGEADVNGAFANGEDEPASVPGGGGGNPNVSSVGGGGGTPIGALLYETRNSGITSGSVNGLVAKLDQAATKLEKGDAGGAVKLLQAFLAQLRGNSGKTVDSTVAELLAAHAQAIIDLLS